MFVCVVGVKKEFAKYSMDIFFVALFRWDGPCMNHPWFWGGGQHGHYSKWHGSIFPVSKYSKSSSGWFCILQLDLIAVVILLQMHAVSTIH